MPRAPAEPWQPLTHPSTKPWIKGDVFRDAAAIQPCFPSSDCCWFLGWHWHLVGLGTLQFSHPAPAYSHQWEEICTAVIKYQRQSWDSSSQATHLHPNTNAWLPLLHRTGRSGFKSKYLCWEGHRSLGLCAVTQSSKMVTKCSIWWRWRAQISLNLRKWFLRVCMWEVSMISPLE